MLLLLSACATPAPPDSGADEVDVEEWAPDADGDGYGVYADRSELVEAAAPPAGYGRSWPDDCDDADAAVHPAAEDACEDAVDQDCDGRDPLCAERELRDVATASLYGGADDRVYQGRVTPFADVDGAGTPGFAISTGYGEVAVWAGAVAGALTPADAAYRWAWGDGAGWVADLGGRVGIGAEFEATVALLEGPAAAPGAASAVVRGDDDRLGRTLVAADCDGDGVPGLWASALAGADGAVYCVDGVAGEVGEDALIGRITFAGYNSALDLANVGDTDGDGFDDLLLAAGEALLFRGPASGTLTPEAADARFVGDVLAVGGGADADGDGLADLLIGAPGADGGGVMRGLSWILAGTVDGTLGEADALAAFSGPWDDGLVGSDVTFVGDMDGDGAPEVAIGNSRMNGLEPHDGSGAFIARGPFAGTTDLGDAWLYLRDPVGVAYTGEQIAAQDLDQDGRADVWLGSESIHPYMYGSTWLVSGGTIE